MGGRAQVAAGARVHGTHQLEARRKFATLRRPRDGDGTGFQWLAQGLQRGAGELGHLVQKQNAVVGQGDLAGTRWCAPVDYIN